MKYVIGIDEVGRGSLAGPVVVAAVAIPFDFHALPPVAGFAVPVAHHLHRGRRRLPLRDSKKLNANQRALWFSYFKHHPKVFYAIAKAHAKTIDAMNISAAANAAALRAFETLVASSKHIAKNSRVFLDGGLFLGNGTRDKRHGKRIQKIAERNTRTSAFDPRISARTMVKADEKITAVKIASIMAKVYRDSLMARLAKKYPKYGFEVHKGYGTKRHMRAIRKHGPSKIHRMTFLRKLKP